MYKLKKYSNSPSFLSLCVALFFGITGYIVETEQMTFNIFYVISIVFIFFALMCTQPNKL
jgi:surface polysaccharide O-acyltransferase-like enzyme